MESMLVLVGLAVLAVPVLLVVVLVALGRLKQRVADLEALVLATPSPRPQAGLAVPTAAPRVPEVTPGLAPAPVAAAPQPAADVGMPGSQAVPALQAPPSMSPQPPPPPPPRREAPSAPRPPGRVALLLRMVKRWFTVGNVPVKIGMLVLLAGVAALLKYASDQGLLRLPIELRLAAVSAAALAALVFAWRNRTRNRSFALAVQGGAIGVLLLVVFAAARLYPLLPPAAAFAFSVALVAGLGVLAVLQDSRTLAVLGILAGFLAPIWLSTGGGSHVALFGYYALLNVAIFAIAWVRSWRVLNLLGFAFTWGIGIAWGVLRYTPADYARTQPFLLLFFVFYLLLPVLQARRRPAGRGDRIDGCLLFGTPLVAFSLQAALLDGARLPLAFCALGLAGVYALLAWRLVRRPRFDVLGQAHALLAVGFATLAVPLALSAQATASVFALEGAALVWLGARLSRALPRWSGFGLQMAAAFAFLVGLDAVSEGPLPPIANAAFMGALLVALAGFASAWVERGAGHTRAAAAWYAWGLAWWCGTLANEVFRSVDVEVAGYTLLLAVAAVTGWLAAEVQRRRPAPALALTTLAGFIAAVPLALLQADLGAAPLDRHGAWAWPLFAVLGVRSLACLRDGGDRFAPWAQLAWWLLWPTVVSLFMPQLADALGLGAGWTPALVALPWLALSALAQVRWTWLARPLGVAFEPMRVRLQGVVSALLAGGWLLALGNGGEPAPLPWLPLVNPLDLAQLAVLVLLARWLGGGFAPGRLVRLRLPLLAGAAVLLATCITLRGVHHWGQVPWSDGMLSTSLAQTALTLVWSVLGVIAWITGSRRGQRALWLAGAVLMAIVLAKLVLVDRQHLGNLLGIGSFIAYGLLCTLVGWFAPAPPRAPDSTVEDAP
ncbi:MAG TPA: DUF2339 domain-containing protein [Luteimonas sp.]|nr:DUF2339 domain-containing protein [Luteimonas sp.]